MGAQLPVALPQERAGSDLRRRWQRSNRPGTRSGWKRDGRQSRWGDRQRWRLEDRLPQLFEEIDIRNAEAEERRLERERRERDKQTQWEEAMERAKKRFARSHRAQILKADMAAFREAQEVCEHADRLNSNSWRTARNERA